MLKKRDVRKIREENGYYEMTEIRRWWSFLNKENDNNNKDMSRIK